MSDLQQVRAIAQNRDHVERLLKQEYQSGIPWYRRGRLTLDTGDPIPTADTNGTTVYFTPIVTGWFNEISIEIDTTITGDTTNGSAVLTNLQTDASQLIVGMSVTGAGIPAATTIASVDSSSQVTMSANATASATVAIRFFVPINTNVDIYQNGNVLYGVIWTSAKVRATAIAYDRGIPYITGNVFDRLLGTVRTGATAGQVEDTLTQRFVSNVYNKTRRKMFVCPNYLDNNAATSYAFNSVNWAVVSAGVSSIEYVVSLPSCVDFVCRLYCTFGTATNVAVGTGFDTTTTATTASFSSVSAQSISAELNTLSATVGAFNINLIARSNGTTTIFADTTRFGGTKDPYLTYLDGCVES